MIIKCEECKANISDTAERCPKCGRNRIVNLLPYQVANRTHQQVPTYIGMFMPPINSCRCHIFGCPNHSVCIKCNYQGNCNLYKTHCFASQAAGLFIFIIVGIVAVAIGIILASSGC